MVAINANQDNAPRSGLEKAQATADEMRSSEARWRLVLDTIPVLVTSARPDGSLDFINQRWLEFLGLSVDKVQDWGWTAVTHPDDIAGFVDGWRSAMATGEPFEGEARVPRADGQFRWLLVRAVPLRDEVGRIVHWYAISIDIEDRKRAETALQRSEAYLAEAQRLSRTGSFGWNVASGALYWSRETFSILGYPDGTTPTLDLVFQRVHPDDRSAVQEAVARASDGVNELELEHRLVLPDGATKHVHVVARAVVSASGASEFVGAVSDVTVTKLAEEQIRRNETEFRQIIDAIPQLIVAMSPTGQILYANEAVLQSTGLSLQDVMADDFRSWLFHPDDLEKLRNDRQQRMQRGIPFELEMRARLKDRQYRWFLVQYKPLRDDQGRVIRWYATGTDIDERKRAEERTQNENLALREEVNRASMFEEIVGSSPAIQAVLVEINKVAPTDSTVLITGETGTGKELIARAIHKRSARSGRAFVTVNCAAVPTSLIASELFGHERGAFTGALQRRQGKFELADGGTIFLDEIGELPEDTQLALLRVLQEREFERVGGSRPIRVDVRVVAATNRDLRAAVGAKSFRADLFYRLNVFPIEVPALRNRAADIPLLVEYFVHRFALRTGKRITRVPTKIIERLQGYRWPGNIRELQNVIERAVIVSETDALSVDERWLVEQSTNASRETPPLEDDLLAHEKARVEAALAESQGRVSGPSGAAARLGVPRSTLESRIRSLKINKHRFKAEP
jgi:formate hydrogenlyase transcriptional activator